MANQIYCKHCGKLIDADSSFCMHCGGAIQDSRKSESFIRVIDTSDTKKVESLVDLIKWIINLKFINFIKQNWKRILIFIIGIAIAVLLVWLGIDKLKSNRAMLIIPAILLIILTLYLSCGKSIKFLLPSSILLLFVYGTYIYDDYKNIYGQDTTFFDTVKREFYWITANYTIPDHATSIGDYAFSDCTSLVSITIPDRVTSIGDFTFYNCTSLTSVYCKATTPPWEGYNMFSYYNCGFFYTTIGCKIYVPRNSVKAYKSAEYWKWYAGDIVGYDF
ncbi:MAG: leucine-rich repeat protein [Alistipes sp.]|nr:leucine-rich repeat protein [Alistipes sp.]